VWSGLYRVMIGKLWEYSWPTISSHLSHSLQIIMANPGPRHQVCRIKAKSANRAISFIGRISRTRLYETADVPNHRRKNYPRLKIWGGKTIPTFSAASKSPTTSSAIAANMFTLRSLNDFDKTEGTITLLDSIAYLPFTNFQPNTLSSAKETPTLC
jgi:hypothetical protein